MDMIYYDDQVKLRILIKSQWWTHCVTYTFPDYLHGSFPTKKQLALSSVSSCNAITLSILITHKTKKPTVFLI